MRLKYYNLLIAVSALIVSCTPLSALANNCLTAAAQRYEIAPDLLRAIAQQEGGHRGTTHANSNGTIDYGPMQINSIWLPKLRPYGYTEHVLRWNRCANIRASAWILARAMARAGVLHNRAPKRRAFWRAIGNYHSHTPRLNRRYARRIWHRYQRLSGQPSNLSGATGALIVYTNPETNP